MTETSRIRTPIDPIQASGIRETGTRELQQDLSSFRVEITVLRADNLPRPTFPFGKKRLFYATLTDGTITRRTLAIQSEKQTVEWNEKLDAFDFLPSSHITISLYSKRSKHEDELIGILDMPLNSQNNISFLLNNVGSAPRVRLYLIINLSEDISTPPIPAPDSASSGVDSPSVTVPAEASSVGMEEAIHSTEVAVRALNSYEIWQSAIGRIQWVMDSLSSIAELHPYAKIAFSLLSVIPKSFLMQVQLDKKINELLDAIHDAFDFAQDASPLQNLKPESKQANILILMLTHVGNCCDFIQSYADKNFLTRFWKNVGTQADKQISDLCSTFVDLRKKFVEQAGLTTEISVFQILDEVGVVSAQVTGISSQLNKMTTQLSNQISDLDLEQKMGEIPYRARWRSGIERHYIPGTRTDFLDHIAKWVTDPNSNRGLVLFGRAGTGKSSIAHEIARRFQVMNRLTSYFTFLRAEQTKREDYHLFTTIIHDLAQRYPSFKTALGKVIRDNKSLRTAQHYGLLFESMLLRPLRDISIVGPVLIIVDGLDESGDVTGPKGLHSFLAEHLADLPANFRVLITSRLEADIVEQFSQVKAAFDIVHMDDVNLSAGTDDDVRRYFEKNLPGKTFEKYGDDLVKKAEGLFQWAAVACGLINSPRPGLTKNDSIHGLLAHRSELVQDLGPLNVLYKQVLEGYFESEVVLRRFRTVIGHLLAAFEPLSIRSLAALHQSSDDESDDDDNSEAVLAIVGHLGSLLSHVTSTDWTLPIVPLHTSFRDFLTDEQLSGPFYVDLGEAHRQLAHSCLGLMLDKLKFNICGLPSSYHPNDKIDDLQSRITEHISSALFYACCFWDDHLERAKFGRDLMDTVQSILEEKLLFWLEVLSLKNSLRLAIPALSSMNVWLASGQHSEGIRDELKKLQELVIDAGSFVRYFGMVIAMSAPHIYVSALPFCPTSSRVARQYRLLFPNTLRLTRGQLTHWPAAMELNIPTSLHCFSVAFSPDGQWIVSGSNDSDLHLWNATTGQMEGSPFTGHKGFVRSVAFSPDGQRIVSGSDDRTVRIWNVATGQMEGSPLTGHNRMVTSVAFSSDGQRIVSGSVDQNICLWNSTTGQMEGNPYTGHTGWVSSVAFSPDGHRIVSGSGDQTIRVWNTTTGQMEGNPFSSYNGTVNSVAFSPDGRWIVAGSRENTIHLWNASTGQMEGTNFIGHTGSVNSVSFSRDGQRIVSGSDDHTIRVWNASTGQVEGSPFTGHTGYVYDAAFSSDGQRIVSCSYDSSIRVWNAATGPWEEAAFNGHTDWVYSVAFSPDGQQIVSGSYDCTIRLWNATTGQMEGNPFIGHTKAIKSVAFSPDGRRIVSGSGDHTIRIWNPITGGMEGGPFIGHTDPVNSVAFSPDGQRVVSSSVDQTIRVWNRATGQMEGNPFIGHTWIVNSVAFSPDGQRIVSGSYDRTIRLWNATTGKMEGSPIRITLHDGAVNSVAFSPDGQWIVSGSTDYAVHVWNATTGKMEGSAFSGHTDSVESVKFSPDGQQIVSGSRDRSIRVWNVATGQMEGSPLTGHSNMVTSVAVSPDGLQIVSGSCDHTIRLWNMTANDTANEIPRVDSSVIGKDGWIRAGSDGGLLLWVPSVHRACLHHPRNVWIVGKDETRLDFSDFVYGQDWSDCYDG